VAPTADPTSAQAAPRARPGRELVTWLGIVPFLLFALAFLGVPTIKLIVGSFVDENGNVSTANYADFGSKTVVNAYQTSIEISLVTSIGAALFGFLLAYAVISGGLPKPIRAAVMTFSGVASNFAGIPLALAFIFTIGRVGLLTVFLRGIGLDPYAANFTLYSKLGLELVYFYFQLPLMVLVIAPAIDGLKGDWREASENLGASSFQFWRYIAGPILLPSLLASIMLLFGNAFGAQATAYQLTGGGVINLVPLLIGDQLSGDVLHTPGKGFALAVGMIVVMAVALAGYALLQRRAERWRR
jgi:putative spermidine/putrescine transport system permease protein